MLRHKAAWLLQTALVVILAGPITQYPSMGGLRSTCTAKHDFTDWQTSVGKSVHSRSASGWKLEPELFSSFFFIGQHPPQAWYLFLSLSHFCPNFKLGDVFTAAEAHSFFSQSSLCFDRSLMCLSGSARVMSARPWGVHKPPREKAAVWKKFLLIGGESSALLDFSQRYK